MKLCILLALLIAASATTQAQRYKYVDSAKVMGLKSYLNDLKVHPETGLAEIKKYIPGITLDLRYATTNNFMHRRMYNQARAFARLPVVLALRQVEANLKTKGLGLKVYDAYRPYSVTVKFYELAHDTNFVADPRKGSKHNRGCAIDLTLIDLKTGKELDMPTGFDSFSKKAASNYSPLPKKVVDDRAMLKKIMEMQGFREIPSEWWHFDFKGWDKYPLLDIPLESL